MAEQLEGKWHFRLSQIPYTQSVMYVYVRVHACLRGSPLLGIEKGVKLKERLLSLSLFVARSPLRIAKHLRRRNFDEGTETTTDGEIRSERRF